MKLRKNVGGRDRFVRGVVGVTSLAVAIGTSLAGEHALALVTAVVGSGLLFNAATQFCGVNALLGLDTCSRK